MIPAHKIVKALAGVTALLAISATMNSSQPAFAQGPDLAAAPPTFHSSGPILAGGGETVLVCAANNQLFGLLPPTPPPTSAAVTNAASVTPLEVTLQILNGVTGAILAQSQVTLPPLGSTATPPDPCVTYVVPPATLAPSINLFVVRVALNPQPLPPGLCANGSHGNILSVSLQVYTPDNSGSPTNIRAISFLPPDPCVRPLP